MFLASQLGSDLEAEVARELHFGPATSLERVLLDHARKSWSIL